MQSGLIDRPSSFLLAFHRARESFSIENQPMNYEEFLKTCDDPAGGVPSGLRPALAALWYERAGQWDRAHRIVQAEGDASAAWVHAYLHRREGDLGNARYWYARAGKPESHAPLEREWQEIVRSLLGDPA